MRNNENGTQWKDLRFDELVGGRVSAGGEVREGLGRSDLAGTYAVGG